MLTITKEGRIISGEFGDITDEVVAALVELSRPDEPVIVEREQAEIAAVAGQAARDMKFGRLVAQLHPAVYDYWTRREGPGFWRGRNLERFLRDNPACRVRSRGRRCSPKPESLKT
jgi:hypothetical protein